MSITGKILFANEADPIFSGQSLEVIIKIENDEKIILKGEIIKENAEKK